MKYAGMPMAMWVLLGRSFRSHLTTELGFTEAEAAVTARRAKPRCREIIARLPEFEKEDRFLMNAEAVQVLTLLNVPAGAAGTFSS